MKAFFDAIRPAFGGKLTGDQVAGMTALLEAGADLPLHHMANVLAQVRRETGGIMAPIKETVQASHKDKNPTDAEVINRLDRAFAKGQLSWVREPYWRDGWFGRGQIQLTHKANYARFGLTRKDDALVPHISAFIAVRGMRDGLFTGNKLADYNFPVDLDAKPSQNPRRIVNGHDGSDAEVARFHRQFAAALEAAKSAAQTDHIPPVRPDYAPRKPTGEPAKPLTPKPVDASRAPDPVAKPPLWTLPYGNPLADFIAGVIAAIASLFRRK